ncbi:hypothetical protein ACX4M0_11790, partial [Roseomonas mucosa]
MSGRRCGEPVEAQPTFGQIKPSQEAAWNGLAIPREPRSVRQALPELGGPPADVPAPGESASKRTVKENAAEIAPRLNLGMVEDNRLGEAPTGRRDPRTAAAERQSARFPILEGVGERPKASAWPEGLHRGAR